jgi:DNA-binding CsgD family transcriptional regulator
VLQDAAAALTPTSRAFHDAMANVLRQAGTSAFYDAMAQLVAELVDCRKWLVMRYAAHDTPAFLVNRAMSERACAYYLKGLYRLDPLNKLARTRPKATVININQLDGAQGADDEYLNALFRSAFIYDELAVLLPAPGGVTVAVCCERGRRRFTRHDIETVESVLEMLDAMHQVHIGRAFTASLGMGEQTSSLRQDDAILIVDDRGNRIFTTDKWRQLEQEFGYCGQIIEKVGEQATGQIKLNQAFVLHWERLGAEFAMAPSGTFLTIAREAPDPLKVSAREAVASFQAMYGLTPREVEIVELVLKGFPNDRIADALGISVGTVKNHRWRLYLKLDITSERELFYLFLSAVVEIDVDSARDSEAAEAEPAPAL